MLKVAPFIFLFLLPFLAVSQDGEPLTGTDPALVTLRIQLQATESITGNIRQEKAFAFLTEKLVSNGVFMYQKESKLRWEFTDPIEYIILINENSMRLKEEGEEKKYKGMNQILRQVKEIILGCIDGSIIDNKNYKTAFFTHPKTIQIQLQPRAKNLQEFIAQIDVQFDKSNAMLQSVTLTDPSRDKTHIVFSDLKINQAINESVFADF